ncbi:hypothetical protein AADZ91_17025 [Colwelliaceae bacterium 6441]
MNSCSQKVADETQMTQSLDNKERHQMMEHSQHTMTVEDDAQANKCCADSCFCDMANCSTSTLAHQLTESYLIHVIVKNQFNFIEQATHSQYLQYLFKPPIQS